MFGKRFIKACLAITVGRRVFMACDKRNALMSGPYQKVANEAPTKDTSIVLSALLFADSLQTLNSVATAAVFSPRRSKVIMAVL